MYCSLLGNALTNINYWNLIVKCCRFVKVQFKIVFVTYATVLYTRNVEKHAVQSALFSFCFV